MIEWKSEPVTDPIDIERAKLFTAVYSAWSKAQADGRPLCWDPEKKALEALEAFEKIIRPVMQPLPQEPPR